MRRGDLHVKGIPTKCGRVIEDGRVEADENTHLEIGEELE